MDVDPPHVNTVPPNFEKQEFKTTTQAERAEREEERKEAADEEREKSASGAETRDLTQGKGGLWASRHERNKGFTSAGSLARNKTNPVVLVNAVLVAAAGAGLGYGAYQKHLRDALTWDMLALWTSGLGVAVAADYVVSG